METIENNKLIAEFMHLETNINHNSSEWYEKKIISSIITENANELNYHKSWDWLMPVVQKIKDTPTYGSIDGVDFVLTCDLTKENLYKSVVEFIKYHNEEKN